MRFNRGGRGFRGGMRGRPPHMQGPSRYHPYPHKFRVTHQVFDQAQVPPSFLNGTPEAEDTQLSQALLKRNQELTPTSAEQVAVQNMVVKVERVVEGLVLLAEDLEVGLDEMKMVGSYKKGTMLSGTSVADMVIVLKELPTAAVIEQLSKKIEQKLKEGGEEKDLTVTTNEGGFSIKSNESATIQCLVTTLPRHLLKADPKVHVDVKLLEGAISTVRHARWFEDNASHTTVRVLVRLLKDIRKRFTGLEALSPWLIDLLAHRSTNENVTREPLTISVAFRRIFKLLAAGIFLPGSVGIIDPCESGKLRAHVSLSLEEQDSICKTSQTLLRCLAYGGFNEILGLGATSDQQTLAIDTDVTTWNGVVVAPGDVVYKAEKEVVTPAATVSDATATTTEEEEQPTTET